MNPISKNEQGIRTGLTFNHDQDMVTVKIKTDRQTSLPVEQPTQSAADKNAAHVAQAQKLGLNPNAYRAHKADTGVPVVKAEQNVFLACFLDELAENGYILVSAKQFRQNKDGRTAFMNALTFVRQEIATGPAITLAKDIQDLLVDRLVNGLYCWANPKGDDGKRRDTVNCAVGAPTKVGQPYRQLHFAGKSRRTYEVY